MGNNRHEIDVVYWSSMEQHQTLQPWLLDTQQVLEVLNTSEEGLSASDSEARKKQYGENVFTTKSDHGVLAVLADQFLSPLIWTLISAGFMTWYLDELIETVVIFGAVVINVLFAFYQEYKAENTIEQLTSYIKNRAVVVRDGVTHDVDARDLVPGDIVSITYGNRIPADGRLIEATGLRIDEAILTGESLPVEKETSVITSNVVAERKNSVFCGTYVTQGVGLFVVAHTGKDTEIGKIAQSVAQARRVKTPVQNAVRQISWYIFALTIFIVIGIFALGVYRGQPVLEMLVLSAAVAVGAVPEALPITLTVILSVGVFAISQKGGLIRKLDAAETLGSTTLILTDKTGTLTKAELSLEGIYTGEELVSADGLKHDRDHYLHADRKKFIAQAVPNIQATVEKIGTDSAHWVYTGGAFDTVILKSIYAFNMEDALDYEGALVVPFNSSNKYSISVTGSDQVILGAPDILIKHSTLTPDRKEFALNQLQELSEQGKRLIAIGKRSLATADEALKSTHTIEGLTIVALFAFSDPLRTEVIPAINDIQSKGVAVKIITGDMAGTALHIAREIGMSINDDEVLSGEQIRDMNDQALKVLLPRIKIFVRVTPEDKMRVGTLYQELGEIVAMTGDGVNDAPALKSMDIGISLGSGSDVAKSAADMILLDNNFKTITSTITEGYKIRSNIQKAFMYLMSTALDGVFVVTGSLLVGLPLPLTALQIIWVNILTGSLPALSYAYDDHHVGRANKREGIFTTKVKSIALGIGTLSSGLLFGLYYVLMQVVGDELVARSLFFVCFATYTLTISYSFKNIDKSILHYNPFSNMRLNTANAVGLLLIIATVSIPFMQQVFHVTSIPFQFWWIVVLWNMVNLLIVEVTKWMFGRTVSWVIKKV